MSSVKIEGNASGTGVFTIASPNSNTNRTLTLPDNTGTIITTASTVSYPKGGPAFSAYRSANQTGITSATFTKVQLNNEDFDTASCFDSTTNYRFTPNVAGYYQFNWAIYVSGTGLNNASAQIYKNGSLYKYGNYAVNAIGDIISAGSEVLYLNGSTDYVEMYAVGTVSSGTVTFVGQAPLCRFSGCLVRAD